MYAKGMGEIHAGKRFYFCAMKMVIVDDHGGPLLNRGVVRLLETGNLEDIMAIYQRLPKGGAGDTRLQVRDHDCDHDDDDNR
jgi:hypothetical protein